jgi:hypothetical protein
VLGVLRFAVLSFSVIQPNPFGAARPREQVIAEREGKKETEVLKEQAHKEWTPTVRHTVSFLNLYFHISIFQLE